MKQGDLFGHRPSGSRIYKLNAEELRILIYYGRHRHFTGGFQSLCAKLYDRVNKVTGEIELDDALVGRIDRYATRYGPGGFQDSFLRPVFRRILNL